MVSVTSKMIWAVIILGYVYALPRVLEWGMMFIDNLKTPRMHLVPGADVRVEKGDQK